MTRFRSRYIATAGVFGGFLCTALACSGLPSPQSDLSTGQAMLDLNQSIVDLREDNAMMQAQIDSLRDVVARQDTMIRQMAAQAGVPIPPAP